jgi:dienelactone hydrolase
MKKVAFAKCIFLLVLSFAYLQVNGQQTFRTTASGTIIGYLEYLPTDYHSNSNKYPVVIFLHGVDERGATSTDPAVLQTTISRVTKLGPPMHVKNGAQFPFILITPQLKDSYGSWPSSYVKEVIEHCKTYLRIDERRIHVTGLSMGGHGTWTCAQDLPSVFASAAPVCGANNSPSKACGIASENVAIWGFHGDADPVVSYTKTLNMVNAINACVPAPTPAAKATIYAGVQHNAWYRAYFLDNNYHNPNVYQWFMLQSKSKRGGNAIPTANAGADKSISGTNTSITGSATDTDGSVSNYSWTQLTGPSKATLSGTTSATVSISNLSAGTYVFKFTVTDNGGLIDSDFVSISVGSGPVNSAPVVNAGSDKVVNLPTNTSTIAATASDTDGTISSYSWTKISGGSATLSGNTTNTLSASGLAAGSYTFRITVTDDKGASTSDDVVVTVNNVPTVSAGADATITLPTNSISLQGTASDTDGSIASYNWTMTTGSGGSLSGTSTSNLTASQLTQGTYVFRLTVKDNLGASKSDDVQVTVKPSLNVAPVANAGSDQTISLPTNSISITGSGTDSDGTIASYAWTKISGGNATITGESTATLNASALVAGNYVFRLTVKDNGGTTASDDVSVFVNTPPTVSAGNDFSITLPTNSLSVQGTASDTDGTIASYSWKMLTGTVADLSGTTTSKLTATNLVEGPYVFRLTVKDNNGASKYDDVKITVLPDPNPNVAPEANAGADQLISLPANSITLTGAGTDSDGTISAYSWSKISGGSATLANANTSALTASALEAGSYIFRLTVQDNGGKTASDDVTVNVNTPPSVSVGADYALQLPENSTSVQGVASDADGTIVSYEWRMTTGTIATLSGTTTSKLTATGLVEGPYVFRLIVKDNNGASKHDDVKITVKPLPNVNPVADAGLDQIINLPKDSTSLTGTATDTDGTIVSYSWSKVSGGTAILVDNTKSTVKITGMQAGSYVFRLTATDDKGGTHSDDVSVLVNAQPIVSVGSDFKITLPTNSVSIQGTASDPDGTIASYQWKMTTGEIATLTETTTSKLTASGLVAGAYVFRLIVKDNYGASKHDDVKIYVLGDPNNVAPVANAGADQLIHLPSNTTTLTGSASDTDGFITHYSWSKVSGGAATLTGDNTATLSISGLEAGTYVFRLSVKDEDGTTSSDDVTIVVNNPPVVSVGADFKITLPTNSLSVQGTASDPDGTIVSYQWKMTTGTVATLTGTNTPTLTATGLIEGAYVFRLIVKDNNGASKFDDVKITVNPQPAQSTMPIASAGPDRVITLPTNATTITGTGSDPDGTITSYQWTKISGGTVTLSNTATPSLGVSETISGKYVFRLTVSDNSGVTHYDDMTLTVNNAPVANAGPDVKITLPVNYVTLNGTGFDADGPITSYTWSKYSGDVATLSGATTPTLSVTDLVEGVYVFRLSVKDNVGSTRHDDVTVTVSSTSAASQGDITVYSSVEDPDAQAITYLNNDYWKDKTVTVFDATGKKLFSGIWSADEYSRTVTPGKLFVYHIRSAEKRVRQGKVFITE